MADRTGVWAYAVAGDLDGGSLRGLTGVSGEPVYPVPAAGLTAVAGAVPLAEFGGEALRRNLEDLAWLERTARSHHEVIESLAAICPVVPMRLATVYHSDQKITGMLTGHRDYLVAALARLGGRAEWGVKVYASPREADAAGSTTGGAEEASPGAAYLRRRKSQLSATEDARRSAAASAEDVHAVVSRLSAAALLRPPQAAQLSGHASQMILNGAYLVDREKSRRLREAVKSLADRHSAVRVELTGPWPPYSFSAMEQSQPVPGAAV